MREPDAWLVTGAGYQYVSLLRDSADAAAVADGGSVVPLYRSFTLTDAEREVIEWAARAMRPECRVTLRGLLERTGNRPHTI